MKHIKRYLQKIHDDLRGVSKGVMAVALTMVSAVCVILTGALLVTGVSLMATDSLMDTVLEMNTDLEHRLDIAQADADTYRNLYKKVQEENKSK